MCDVGDIILVSNYNDSGNNIGRHSFVVLSEEAGKIRGLDYDMICNVISSFKNEKQHDKKMSYTGNFPIAHDDFDPINGNSNRGYIKAEQFYYFNKSKLNYMVIGKMKPEIFQLLLEFIDGLEIPIQHIIDNL